MNESVKKNSNDFERNAFSADGFYILTDFMSCVDWEHRRKMQRRTIPLKCPQCGEHLTYLNVPRTSFSIKDTKPNYDVIKNQYNCPFCNYGIAGFEELALQRLKEGYKNAYDIKK